MSPSEVVPEPLLSPREAPEEPAQEGHHKHRHHHHHHHPLHKSGRAMLNPSVTAARLGGLVKYAWLLNDLLPDEQPKLDFASPAEQPSGALGKAKSVESLLDGTGDEMGWMLQAVLVGLLSHLATFQRLMVLLHLQARTCLIE